MPDVTRASGRRWKILILLMTMAHKCAERFRPCLVLMQGKGAARKHGRNRVLSIFLFFFTLCFLIEPQYLQSN